MKKLLEALSGVVLALISLLIALLRASEDESLLTTVVRAVLTYLLLLSWLPFVYSMVSIIIDISTVTQRPIPNTPLNPGEFENIAVGMASEYIAKALNDLITLIITAIGSIIASMIYRGIAGNLEDVASTTSYSSA
jgi:ABC-type glycerol-3-phosphate transport system permease component